MKPRQTPWLLAALVALSFTPARPAFATGDFHWENIFGDDFDYKAVLSGGALCPAPGPGECVYHRTVPTANCGVSGKSCKGVGSFAIGMKQLTYMVMPLLDTPAELLSPIHSSYLTAHTNELPTECKKLKAICFDIDYTQLSEVKWYISAPVTFSINEEILAQEIPIILDFRGTDGQQTQLTTHTGFFDTNVQNGGVPLGEQQETCAITFGGAHVTAIGFTVTNMPGHGICTNGTDLKFQQIASIGNGCDGLVVNSDWTVVTDAELKGNGCNGATVNGDNNTLDDVDASYNTGNGVELNGSGNTIQDSLLLNNGDYGVKNNEGAKDNKVKDSTVAGNAAGNIFDATNTLILDNVSDVCPPRYQQDGIYCRLLCPFELLDYLGTCVEECPAKYIPDTIGICRRVDQAVPTKGGGGKGAPPGAGCSLIIR